jgi:hypothetical protein
VEVGGGVAEALVPPLAASALPLAEPVAPLPPLVSPVDPLPPLAEPPPLVDPPPAAPPPAGGALSVGTGSACCATDLPLNACNKATAAPAGTSIAPFIGTTLPLSCTRVAPSTCQVAAT